MQLNGSSNRDGVQEKHTPISYWLGLVLLLVALNLIRSPARLLLPTLRVEDGTHVFAYFYENRHISEIFRFKAGYLPLVANIIGYCSVRLPTRLVPYALTWFPLGLSIASFSILFSNEYGAWIPAQAVRGIACMLFALSPLANTNLRAHTDYSIWSTLFMLILLAAHPLPERAWRRYLWFGVINVLAWSHPLTIVVLPIFVLNVFRHRDGRVLYGLSSLNLLVHQLVGVESSNVLAGLGPVGIAERLVETTHWTVVVVIKTGFAALFGDSLLESANQSAWFLFAGWSLLVTVGLGLVYHRFRRARGPILYSLYHIFGLTFMSLLIRGRDTAGLIDGGKRYVHIQGLLFLLIYAVLSYYLSTKILQPLARNLTVQRGRLLYKVSVIIPICFILIHHLILGYDIGDPPSHAIENGIIVRRFFNELAELEKSRGSYKGIYLVADKKDDWPIVIDTR